MSNIALGIAPYSDIQFTQLGAELSKMHRFLLLLASLLIATTRLADAATGGRRSWAELSGKNSWDGLLDPLDVDLRRAIIRYGELAQATSDAFIDDPASPYFGASRYAPAAFLRKAQVPTDPDAYRVTRFLYATSTGARVSYLTRRAPPGAWSTESNWMGYVAVATDRSSAALGRRDVVVAWRGTKRAGEWANDLDITLVPAAGVVGGTWPAGSPPSVHRGFLSVYVSKNSTSRFNKQSARRQVS
jgi:hypothetical protein